MSVAVGRMVSVGAAIAALSGCGLSFGGQNGATQGAGGDPSALTCTSTTPVGGDAVTAYPVAPVFLVGAWWYIGQEPPEVATDEPIPVDEPVLGQPVPPPQTDPTEDAGEEDDGTEQPEEPDPPLGTQALHPADFGGACFTCDLTCTIASPQPNQPAALRTAHGVSATSHGAACRNAEQLLTDYASTSYNQSLDTCGYSQGT